VSLGKEADKPLDDHFNSIKQIPEVKNTIDKVSEFLNDCESKGLIKFPNNELIDYFKKADSRAVMNVLAQSAETRIINKQNNDNFIPKREWIAFQMRSTIDMMRTYAEELKINLKLILNPDLIDPNINELGTYLRTIYARLGYGDDKKREMNEIFQVNLRNSLSHVDYEISDASITYFDKHGTPTTLTSGELGLPIMQMTAIDHVFDKKIKEIKSRNS